MTSGLFSTAAYDATNKILTEIQVKGAFTNARYVEANKDINKLGAFVVAVRTTGDIKSVPKTPKQFKKSYKTLGKALDKLEINKLLPRIMITATPSQSLASTAASTPSTSPSRKKSVSPPYFTRVSPYLREAVSESIRLATEPLKEEEPVQFEEEFTIYSEKDTPSFVPGTDYNKYLAEHMTINALLYVLEDIEKRAIEKIDIEQIPGKEKENMREGLKSVLSILKYDFKIRKMTQGLNIQIHDDWYEYIPSMLNNGKYNFSYDELKKLDKKFTDKIISTFIKLK